MADIQLGDTIISAIDTRFTVGKIEEPYAYGEYKGYEGEGFYVYFRLDSLERQDDGAWKVKAQDANL